MKKFIVIFAAALLGIQAFGQTTTVEGVVLDSLTRAGEPAAILQFYRLPDTDKAVAFTTTDEEGRFSHSFTLAGDYIMVFDNMGRKVQRRSFTVPAGTPVVNLGEILAQDSAEMLKAGSVTAMRPLVKMEVDKMTYNVEDDADSKTSTVLDMLRKVPMVSVDGQDNISVNGSSSFQVYVDGKPNQMLSQNASTIFKMMPASSVKNIEVVTNPGVKYDAEGVGGVLNITTNKEVTGGSSMAEGFYGTVMAMGSTRGGGAGVSGSLQKGKFAMSLNANVMYNSIGNTTSDVERVQDNGFTMKTHSSSKMSMPIAMLNSTASYDIDSLNLVSATLGVMHFGMKQSGGLTNTLLASPGADPFGYDGTTQTVNNRTNLCKLILKNTSTMWKNLDISRYPIVFCNYDWTKPYTGEDKDASMGAMCSGTSLMENTARMCRAIVDRYELGTLVTECSKYNFEDGQYGEAEMAAFNTALQAATEIMDAPSNYTTYQFRKAIQNLEAAYQAVLASKLEDLAIIDDTPLDIKEEKTYPHITYTRTYNGKWEPLYVPFSLKYEDWAEEYDVADIFDVLQCDTDNDGIMDETELLVTVLKDGETSPNRPYLIRAKSPGEKTLTMPDATVFPTNDGIFNYNFLDYTYTIYCYYNMLTIAQTYTIQDGELVYSEEETALSPQRWCMSPYANAPTSTANIPARIRIITTEDYANGCIAPASFLESNETIYDLTGRMVNGKWSNGKWKEGNLPRGIYIIGGRKVFVK